MNVPHEHISYKKLSCRRYRATLRVIEYFAKSLNVIQTGTIQKFGCGFLFALSSMVTMALSCISSDSGAGRVSGQNGQNSSEYCHPFGVGKLDWQCYSMVKKKL